MKKLAETWDVGSDVIIAFGFTKAFCSPQWVECLEYACCLFRSQNSRSVEWVFRIILKTLFVRIKRLLSTYKMQCLLAFKCVRLSCLLESSLYSG